MDGLAWKANGEPRGNILLMSIGSTWRVIVAWHCCSPKVIDANYSREKSPSRAHHAGTVLDGSATGTFPRIYGALSRKSLTSMAAGGSRAPGNGVPRLHDEISTSWPAPWSGIYDATKRRRDENRPSSRSGCARSKLEQASTRQPACLTRKMNMTDMHVFLM